MKEIFNILCNYGSLNEEEAYKVLTTIMAGDCNENQMSAFLTVYMMRKPSIAELTGFRSAIMERCIQLSFKDSQSAIDIVGTGGDGKNSFNISTLSAIVTAAAGIKVIKHGNYGASSTTGSSNILEHLGYRFSKNQSELEHQLDTANICFLHAPLFHPGLKSIAPVRKNLGLRTFFNLLGPLVNPTEPGFQLLGVADLETARIYNYLLQNSSKCYAIIHSLDGYDEVSLTDSFKMITKKQEQIYKPSSFGLKTVSPSAIDGGNSIKEAGTIFTNILNGKGTLEQNNVVAINSGLAIHLANPECSIEDAIEIAREALISLKALQTFNKIISK